MEAAAVGIVAEEVVSTSIQAGVVYGVAKPTPALSATFKRISNETIIPRINHSVTVIDGSAYLFGGETENGKLASDEVHIIGLPFDDGGEQSKPDYKSVPALGEGQDGKTPGSRAGHTAVGIAHRIFVFGGRGEDGKAIEEMGRVWVFDTKTLGWSYIDAVDDNEASMPPARYQHSCVGSDRPSPPSQKPSYSESFTSTMSKIPSLVSGTSSTPAADQPIVMKEDLSSDAHGTLIVHGGLVSSSSPPVTDTWLFDISTRTWSSLAFLPSSGESPNPSSAALALTNDIIYTISGTSQLSHDISSIPLKISPHPLDPTKTSILAPASPSWTRNTIPTNPLTPGPQSRIGAVLLPVTSGVGRHYLLYLMGESAATKPEAASTEKDEAAPSKPTGDEEQPLLFSDAWAYGLPPPTLTPAGLKDKARSTVGMSTPPMTWAEVRVEANIEEAAEEGAMGKAHPGPRAWFAADGFDMSRDGGRGVVLWGGRNGRGEVEGDGWVVSVG
ncbi:MAG: hypothetical protein OHK93_005311 [Ramalina farinacea]|uniref:Galactose oxidase n=1 Tax=Ramalina farinacea TaxID=258253 RepID=A0AA43QVT5_9LECA|nr:hypothetical protein [Ramalina farinacea]